MFTISFYVLPTILFLILVRKYRESRWGKCKNTVKLDGKLALVTGANSGIGFEIAKELAARNAHVILACRNLDNANSAIERIKKALLNDPLLVPMTLDLSSLHSVKEFAQLVKKNYSKIDLLINNAGVAYPRSQHLQTVDGFEMHFGTNHLGHFYLTNLLQDLVANAQGRIIVVASALHEKGKIDMKAIKNLEFGYNENLYANSKLANIYFAQELAKRTRSKGIKVYAICPGWVYTNLFRFSFRWYHFILLAPIAFWFMRSAKQGAQTAIYCATEPSLENETGLLYRDCTNYRSKVIFYDKVALELWEESEHMIQGVIKD